MITELDDVVRSICESGLMAEKEVSAFLQGLPSDRKPADGQQLLQQLVRAQRLTKFQAQAVHQGKAKGLVMGNYVLLDKLGEGGMGQVFKAQHRRMERVVALKILPAEAIKSEESVQRFHREVKAAARLTHPNIVRAYDADEAHGLHFLVMEYMEGTDLATLVEKKGPLAAEVAADYICQAARGLEYAHEQKIIHRDIKPANLVLDTTGTVKILDMGLARIEETPTLDDRTVDGALTRDGDVMGTVDYMSPEQGLNTKKADARSDVYSLGCTLYYLLTGRAMYEGESLMEKLLAHREKTLPPLREQRKDITAAMDAAFRRMVAKKPERRLQTMGEVVAEMERCAGRGRQSASIVRPATSSGGLAETVQVPAAPAPAPTAAASTFRAASPTVPPEPMPKASRREDALKAAKRHKQEQEHKSAWQQAVKAADRNYSRRHGLRTIDKILGFFGKAGNLTFKLVVIVGVVGGSLYVGSMWWGNRSLVKRCEEQVLATVNKALGQTELNAITAVDFTNASAFGALPDILSFESPVVQATDVGRRPVANLTGQYDRIKGIIELNIDRATGADLTRIPLAAEPVAE
ncbi:MAG: serine/threonine protein kinase [Rhodopirellula sp.]|nr:serine/threonine protein kinase [Rhodopirellula sp.]